MNIEETTEAIKVMQAYVDGKEVEQIDSEPCCGWEEVSEPLWNWDDHTYRIAKPEPVEICVGMELIGVLSGDPYKVLAIASGHVWYWTDGNHRIHSIAWVIDHLLIEDNGTKRTLKAPEAK